MPNKAKPVEEPQGYKIVDGALDFKTVSKSKFRCFQLTDGSIYYGETGHLSTVDNKVYLEIEELPSPSQEDQSLEAREKSATLVRHGYGIQIYGRNPEEGNRLCYYSGKWTNDEKVGSGAYMVFPDGLSTYKGSYNGNKFQSKGTLNLKVSDGKNSGIHSFTGNFVDGMLDGEGKFEHGITKQKFEPKFNFNHFVSTGGAFSKGKTH